MPTHDARTGTHTRIGSGSHAWGRTGRPITERERVTFAGWLCALMLIVVLASLGCEGCTMPALNPPTSADVRDDEYGRLVKVSTDCVIASEVPGSMVTLTSVAGSGIRIGGHAILTARHVVDCELGIPSVTVEDIDQKTHIAKVVALLAADVARLEVEDLAEMPPIDVVDAELGDQVCAVVRLPEPGRICGEVEPSHHEGDPGEMRVRFVAEHGNSGGAVFNMSGGLVGILVHLRQCLGTNDNGQVCTAGVTRLAPVRWVATP